MELEKHYVNRSNWLRAAVLGANDGILSTASIAVGVAAASTSSDPVIISTWAGLVAGALSMAAGEYVSVSSQADVEQADLAREKKELQEIPEIELQELAKIYIERGLSQDLAQRVAIELTEHNALLAHARDELGINEITSANPLQAALASAFAFFMGGALPLLVVYSAPFQSLIISEYICTIFFLIFLGYTSAKLGGSSVPKAILRITIWGTIAMAFTGMIGHFFGVNI